MLWVCDVPIANAFFVSGNALVVSGVPLLFVVLENKPVVFFSVKVAEFYCVVFVVCPVVNVVASFEVACGDCVVVCDPPKDVVWEIVCLSATNAGGVFCKFPCNLYGCQDVWCSALNASRVRKKA